MSKGVITIEEQIRCVRREISMRERDYPTFIAQRRILETTANHELAAMRSVLATLESVRDNPPEKTGTTPEKAHA